MNCWGCWIDGEINGSSVRVLIKRWTWSNLFKNYCIKTYDKTGVFIKEETRNRKLLLHKKEILKLRDKIEKEGYTLIPLKIYFKKNKVKVLIGLCKGKKNYDKRETLKEKDIQRRINKELKDR